mgnify:CR=1 FL=1
MALCCSDIDWASVLPVLLFVIPAMAGIQIGASIYLRRQTVFPAKAGIQTHLVYLAYALMDRPLLGSGRSLS